MEFIEPREEHIASLITLVKGVYLDKPDAMWYDHEPDEEELAKMFREKLALVRAWQAADAIAIEAGEVAGECEIIKESDGIGVVGIIVRKEFRSRGIGKELLLFAEKMAVSIGISTLRADVSASNKRAVEFFKRMGFRTVPAAAQPAGGRETESLEKIL